MMHEHFSLSSWKVITKINVLFAFFFPPSQVRTSVLPDHKEPRADAGVSNFLKNYSGFFVTSSADTDTQMKRNVLTNCQTGAGRLLE